MQVLLAQVKQAKDDDEKLELYDRTLELEPNQAESMRGRQTIWKGRGDDAWQGDDFEMALHAYQQADMPDLVAKVEAKIRAVRLEQSLHELQTILDKRRYQQALELAKKLHAEYPEESESLPDLTLLERKTTLDSMYQQSLGALQTNDMDKAQDLLVKVISLGPTYMEATRYLHLAVTGVDVVESLQIESKKLQKAKEAIQVVYKERIAVLEESLQTEQIEQKKTEEALNTDIDNLQLQLANVQEKFEQELQRQVETKRKLLEEVEKRRLTEYEIDSLKLQLENESEKSEIELNSFRTIMWRSIRLGVTAGFVVTAVLFSVLAFALREPSETIISVITEIVSMTVIFGGIVGLVFGIIMGIIDYIINWKNRK